MEWLFRIIGTISVLVLSVSAAVILLFWIFPNSTTVYSTGDDGFINFQFVLTIILLFALCIFISIKYFKERSKNDKRYQPVINLVLGALLVGYFNIVEFGGSEYEPTYIEVTVLENGYIVEEELVTDFRSSLESESNRIGLGFDSTIMLKVDKAIRHSRVEETINEIKSYGFKKVSFNPNIDDAF